MGEETKEAAGKDDSGSRLNQATQEISRKKERRERGEVSKRERSNRRRSSPHYAQIVRGGETFTFPLICLTSVKCREQHLKNAPVKILKL